MNPPKNHIVIIPVENGFKALVRDRMTDHGYTNEKEFVFNDHRELARWIDDFYSKTT